jgi:hypothetical protein
VRVRCYADPVPHGNAPPPPSWRNAAQPDAVEMMP